MGIDIPAGSPPFYQNIVNYFSGKFVTSPLYLFFRWQDRIGINPKDLRYNMLFDPASPIGEEKILPYFDCTTWFYYDLIFRYCTKQNMSISIFGPKGSGKSATSWDLGIICARIAHHKWRMKQLVTDDYTNYLHTLSRGDLEIFDVVILDEQDRSIGGSGTAATRGMTADLEDRIRARQVNPVRCSPRLRPWLVADFYLEILGMDRINTIRCLLYDSTISLRGILDLPIPPDSIFDIYWKSTKKEALDATINLSKDAIVFQQQVSLMVNYLPGYPSDIRGKTELRRAFIWKEFPELGTESAVRRVEKLSRDEEALKVILSVTPHTMEYWLKEHQKRKQQQLEQLQRGY